LLNTRGEKIGHIEVVQDITERTAQMGYLQQAVERLANGLAQLAQGVVNFELAELPEGNEYTRQMHAQLAVVFDNLKAIRQSLVGAVSEIIHNAQRVQQAAADLAQVAEQAGEAVVAGARIELSRHDDVDYMGCTLRGCISKWGSADCPPRYSPQSRWDQSQR
jgi:hypothetical protein